MKLRDFRISTKLLLTLLPLFFLAIGTSAYLNAVFQERDMIDQAQGSAQPCAELTRKALVEQMVRRQRIDDDFLKRLSTGGNIDSLHICFVTDSLHLKDEYQSEERIRRLRRREMEARASSGGEDVCRIGETVYRRRGEEFNALIPFKAVARCQTCHDVPEGHVLGVAAMNISLTQIGTSVQKSWNRSFNVFLLFAGTGIVLSGILYRVLIAPRPTARV